MMRLNLQFFGGRGSGGGRRQESSSGSEATQTAAREKTIDEMNYGEAGAYFAAHREELGLSKNEDAYTAAYNVKQGTWKIVDGKVVKPQAPKPASKAAPKPAAPKPPAGKKSSSPKATGSKKIDNMVESLRSNTNGTIIGTAGNTTYVIEAHKTQSTYVKPNGVRSTGTVTRFNVTPIRKGTDSADVKFFRNSDELKDYMKSKGATWKSRKKKLSDKQKNKFFD